MDFSTYLSNISSVINKLITLISSVLNYLMNNNIFKTLLFVIIVSFVIDNFEKIIDLILNIFSKKVDSSKNKVNSNKDIE